MAEKNKSLQHWSQLDVEEQIRFWQGVDSGDNSDFITPVKNKKTKRRRGEHSTRPKCENPAWFRPARYKKLSGQLGYAYNRLVRKDPETGMPALRIHISRHPHYIQGRVRAGRKNRFKPEKARLVDSLWPVLVSFCDAGMHTVGMCVSRLAKELSVKDAKGNVIKETEVTVSRLSRVIAEQERYGTLARSAEKQYDHLTKTWLPKYVWITDVGFNMLGVDLMKLAKEQEKALRVSEVRQQLIAEGVMEEWEDISPHAARKRYAEKMTLQAIKYRREKAARAKRAKRLATMPWDAQVEAMAEHILKNMPREEAYYATKDRLEKLAIQQLYQMELYQSGAPPN